MHNEFTNQERAQVLTQALPYIKKYSGKIVVIKYGGNAMINEDLKQQVMEDIALLWLIGVKVVLIHGGGPEISETMKKFGKKSEFVNGLRVTDKEAVDIPEFKGDIEGVSFTATHAEGEKCARCWKYSGDIGSDAEHPCLCARCASVLK